MGKVVRKYNGFFTEGNGLFKYSATNYTDLSTQLIEPNTNDIAYVYNAQGSQWLPGTLGGTYYPYGFYIYDGANWVSDRNAIANQLEASTLKKQIRVDQNNAASILGGVIDSTFEYFIDGIIDCSGFNIEVGAGGIRLNGYSFDNSQLVCSDNSYSLFTSAVGGSGNIVLNDLGIEISGTGSQVFNLTANTGFEAVEINAVNYNNCTSRGTINGYRQGLESGVGMFGGAPELILSGTWIGGWRITTSIVRSIDNITALYKAGGTLSIGGRFVTDINADLNTNGALFDFSDSNIVNDESLIVKGAYISRNGNLNTSDTTLYPNITQSSTKSLWSDNTGFPNTTKYIKNVVTTATATTISLVNTYYVLSGTWTVERSSHIEQVANGILRLLSGNGVYNIVAEIILEGTNGDDINIRVTKSTDGGATFPTVINSIERVINNLAGARDVAFFPLNFISDLKKDDRIRIEVENKTAARNVTAEVDSYINVIAV